MRGAWIALGVGMSGTASAQDAAPVSYALLVGSNQPGPGQQPLQHAITDAHRVAGVLTALGGYAPERVTVLADPDADALQAALVGLEARLQAHDRRDEDTVVLFYYSGHARASGLNLGPDEVPLRELRARLDALPATVRLVVLDACQSGALAQPKGALPAADFSYSSLHALQAEGTVVMASSAADELSQESDRLQGGFFTHHLLAGLRGAADLDRDGRVDLDEAYRYTYRTTLQSTTATAVGGQHVTLQRDLHGHGEMILTRPAQSRARLSLPVSLSGEILLSLAASGAVVAEIHKAAGEPMQLALPAGSYAVILRTPGTPAAQACPLNLPEDALTLWDGQGCQTIPADTVARRGDGSRSVSLELGVGYLFPSASPYTDRLEDFSFGGSISSINWTLSAALGVRGPLSLVLSGGALEFGRYRREYTHDELTTADTFRWETGRLSLSPRASRPLGRGGLVPYAQAGVGVAFAHSTFDADSEAPLTDLAWGPLISTAAGLQLLGPRRHMGLFLQGEYTYASVLHNLLGDRHISGGPLLTLGLRAGR